MAQRLLQAMSQELEELAKKLDRLEAVKSRMEKFVPRVVKELIEKNPYKAMEKHEQDVSILILDISGCSILCETLTHRDMNYIIERYFSTFLDDIHRYHGDVNETMGDGLMAIFEGSGKMENALNATRAALAIGQSSRRLNDELRGEFDPIAINVGISSGSAAVGVTKLVSMAGERWTYTASGPITNLSSRLCSAAEEGAILIDEETAKRIQSFIGARELEERHFKNISAPVRVFMVQR